ncbi:hypothetical protein phiPsal1_029 [Pontimonas phage phiPsal1]|nr:hypothetical protein phiPsal1_029 [Pontimonas phage phiPsal1]
MGYFKNQLIANQVELGDRVPVPKPATDHIAVALQGDWLTKADKVHEHNQAIRLNVAVCFALAVGIVLGFTVAVFA